MRTLITINYYTQLILAVATAVSLLMLIGNKEFLLFLLLIQFFVGCIQILFSFCWLFADKKYPSMRQHFTLALVNVIILIVFSQLEVYHGQPHSVKKVLMVLFGVVIPWSLALYYWVISWKLFQSK